MKIKNIKSIAIALTCCIVVFICFALDAHPGISTKTTQVQIWTGTMSGMFVGKIQINARQNEGDNGEIVIDGKLKVKLKSARGYGSGYMRGIFKGRIKDGLLKARINATAYVTEGSSQVHGTMIGTMFGSQGFGTYELGTSGGSFTGEWNLEKEE